MMQADYAALLQNKLGDKDYRKLMALDNPKLHKFVADAVELCRPDSVLVVDDSPEAMAKTRSQVKAAGEEKPLTIEGHTVHFDGMQDQGRDRAATKYLVPEGESLSKALN